MRPKLQSTWALLFMLVPMLVFSQTRQISGTVAGENGNPLPSATIIQKGTTKGVSANESGQFSLSVSGDNPILVVSSTGYNNTEVVIGTQANYNIVLTSSGRLDEVVVTALGISRSQKSVGYATQTVRGENLTLTKEQNVIGSLAGKVSGVQVVGSSGASLGGTQKIKIRGVNSLNGNDQPLMVVDGTPISNANYGGSNGNGPDLGNIAQDINPDDIESVSVLKGPAASALYGLRGQYGVILITTKKGKKGPKKVGVQYSGAYSIEKAGNFLPLQNIYGVGNNQTFLTLANGEKYVNGNDESWGPKMDGTPVRMYYSFYPQDPEFGKPTPFLPQPNNIRDYFETGSNLNNNISVSGGSENMTYKLSYNNAQIKGVMPNTSLIRNNLSLNTSLDVTSKLTVGANVNLASNRAVRPSQGYQGTATGQVQWFQRNIDMKRLRNFRYPDGTILNWNVNPNTTTGIITNNRPSDWNNPYFDAYANSNDDNRDRMFGDLNLNYQVIPELRLSAFMRADMFTQNISHREAFGGRLDEGYAVGKFQAKEFNYEFLGQYNKVFGEVSVNVNVGANKYTVNTTAVSGSTVGGLSSPAFYSLAGSVARPNLSSAIRNKEIRSVYGMASLGYKDIYFLDASIRNDVSSALPVNNNSYSYPSVSASIVFSELLNLKFLSFGKLRGSYAVAGGDLSPYQTGSSFNIGTVYTGTASTINTLSVPDVLNNPDIKPSFGKAWEAGVDLRFLNNRVGLDVSLYRQRNVNQIISLDVSGASGYSSTVVNAGMIENRGVELSLNARPVDTKFFTWNTTLNYARNRSLVKELYPGINVYQLDANVYSSVPIFLNAAVNEPFGSLVGQAYLRDVKTGKIMLDAANLPMFETNHNFGSVLPDFTGGFLNNFRLGNFTLAAFIDFQSGGQFFSWTKMLAVKSGQAEETAALNDKGSNVRDPLASGGGVKVEGISSASGQEVTAYVDARSYFRNTIGTRIYEEWLFDASYVKLREVSLGYTFNSKLFKGTPIKSTRLALIARNPKMLWQKAPRGLEPSELSSGSGSISWLEKGEFQTVRSYGVSLNVSF
ncbi:SusC/RagA family TonB-linked outer membrane protein [Segetibacter sp. 3557_3]|uniref:SusC/RagA family TonB-linked outer membrane protein n=1 Tax=Segetibacter sp. 3557_3 TaxID=2547429 RepID=UPI0010586F7A|nr:SusC/RagA family TonB-linked outer membrane protein [Segetibacter sp. 3557_3]TDH21486.1 SusC/RagA family TonB-linked outer membrane protein [Segetibacter sp. 3557_3]